MTCRQAIVEAMVVRLKGILIAGGYYSDVGENAFVWFPENLAVPDAPCLLVQDSDDTITTLDGLTLEHTLRIDVEGQLEGDEDTVTDVYDLLGDIIRAVMGPADRTLGGLCESIQPVSGGNIKLEQRAEDVAGAVSITFEVKFRTQRGDWSVKI